MDIWMDGWVDGMDGWIEEGIVGYMDGGMNECSRKK